MPITINGSTGIAGVDGSASTPAIQGTDTNTGVTFPAADTVGISTGGTERMRVDSSGNLNFTGTAQRITGDFSNATPSNRLSFQTSTTNSTTSVHVIPNGSNVNAFFEANNSSDPTNSSTFQLGMDGSNSSRLAAGARGSGSYLPMTFWTTNTERARITSDGYFLIGTTSNSTYGAAQLCLPANGEISVSSGALRSRAIYNTTTSNGANQFVDINGYLYRSTSSLKYKTDVQDADFGLADVMALRPVTYKGKNDGEKRFGGLIAEEVHDAGLSEFVQYAEDGSPDSLAYGHMVSLCIKAIQELNTKIDAMQEEINALKGAD